MLNIAIMFTLCGADPKRTVSKNPRRWGIQLHYPIKLNGPKVKERVDEIEGF